MVSGYTLLLTFVRHVLWICSIFVGLAVFLLFVIVYSHLFVLLCCDCCVSFLLIALGCACSWDKFLVIFFE